MFSKNFVVNENGVRKYVKLDLSDEQESLIENDTLNNHVKLLSKCLNEAKKLAISHKVNTELCQVNLAITLFEKMASHVSYIKEEELKKSL